MTHIVAGYPSIQTSKDLALTMAKNGASFIEIQIPFSDPIADGPTISRANQKSLDQGTKVTDCFKLASEVINQTDTPILFMTYFNIIHKYGLQKFIEHCHKIGIYDLIVPDIPYDSPDGQTYIQECQKNDIHPIHIVSPITPDDRLSEINKIASGFVYCVSKFGLTGSAGFSASAEYISKVKRHIKTPIALGFGISNKEDVRTAAEISDITVIGSAVIKVLEKEGIECVKEFMMQL